MTDEKRTEKTACKLLNAMLACVIVIVLGLGFGCLMKASAPVAEIATDTKEVTEGITVSEREETRPAFLDLGEFELTAYCPCSECSGKWGDMTSTGVTARAGRTIAVDEDVIPYGYEVIINDRTYVAEDCGGAIIGKRIDIYFDSHSEALEFGRQTANVLLKIEEQEC